LDARPPYGRSRADGKPGPRASLSLSPRRCRVRQDKISCGKVTLRYRSKLYHAYVGRGHEGNAVLILVKDRDVRILTAGGELIRQFNLDPKRSYQPMGSQNRP
jgi:hypothetical protein